MPQSPFSSRRLEAACQRALQGAACKQTAPTRLPASPIALSTCTLQPRRCFPPEDVAEGPGCPSAGARWCIHTGQGTWCGATWQCWHGGAQPWLVAWDSSGMEGKGTTCTQLPGSLSHAPSPHEADQLSWLQLSQAKGSLILSHHLMSCQQLWMGFDCKCNCFPACFHQKSAVKDL